MRLVAGADVASTDIPAESAGWAQVVAGPWLAETLKALRSPQDLDDVDPGDALKGTLRPYQQVGVRWLHLLTKLGLGACLADDMGLGKTIQVLALLLLLKRESGANPKPSLLIVPASLLANWASEIERFAPGLKTLFAHPSAVRPAGPDGLQEADAVDLAITTYGYLSRAEWIAQAAWRLVILDEAQAIKNPNAKQTRAVKDLKPEARMALTGTPIENRLGDLWSLFDFINPGLLGSAKEFTKFTKRLAEGPQASYGPLRELVKPYILRRLKTDKSVISDLPDKTEMKAFCPLTCSQAVLYQQAVSELAEQLGDSSGIKRKGLVLSYLMRFKQSLQPSVCSGWVTARVERRRQRQVDALAGNRGSGGREAGKNARVHAVPRDDLAAGRISRLGIRTAGPRAARRNRRKEPRGPRTALSGRRIRGLLCAVAEGRGHGSESDRCFARRALRPVVEPGG